LKPPKVLRGNELALPRENNVFFRITASGKFLLVYERKTIKQIVGFTVYPFYHSGREKEFTLNPFDSETTKCSRNYFTTYYDEEKLRYICPYTDREYDNKIFNLIGFAIILSLATIFVFRRVNCLHFEEEENDYMPV